MPELNRYGRRALEHWKTSRPRDYQEIPEPERQQFFSSLGDQIEEAVGRRALELTDQQEPETVLGFRQRYALLSTLQQDAERQVLGEMLSAPAEEDPARN